MISEKIKDALRSYAVCFLRLEFERFKIDFLIACEQKTDVGFADAISSLLVSLGQMGSRGIEHAKRLCKIIESDGEEMFEKEMLKDSETDAKRIVGDLYPKKFSEILGASSQHIK